MDECKSASRFSSIKDAIILMQTDTTVGFLSQNSTKLYEAKSRIQTKPFIKVFRDFKALSSQTRVYKNVKRFIRKSKKTTFIVKDISFRVVPVTKDSQILREHSWFYSTSANKSNEKFDRTFCEQKADIIIEDIKGLVEKESSTIFKLSRLKKRKIR